MSLYRPETPIDIDPRYGTSFLARSASVASPSKLASIAGFQVLAQGGNAIDAMVAVNSTMGVTFPHMTGAGGDAFWLIYDAKTGKTHALNASGRSGANATQENFADQKQINQRGPRSVITVPGAVSGWCEAHKQFGKLPFADCLKSAIRRAHHGFPVNASLAKYAEHKLETLRTYTQTARTFLKDGVAPPIVGDTLSNPHLARTLETIAEGGHDAFYRGDIAQEIVRSLQAEGGILTTEDFANHKADWVDPVSMDFRGGRVVAPPPNSEGLITLQILGMLEELDTGNWGDDPVSFIDDFTRATSAALRDRDHYLNDPDFYDVPCDKLLSREYLAERAQSIQRGYLGAPETGLGGDGDTTFSCAVDAEGNAVAVIQSLYWEWGSGFVGGDTGVMLQNRGSFFSLNSLAHNDLQPGKRPAHTLTCSMVLNEQGPELIVGAMGGDGQPQTQALLIKRIMDQGYSVQHAVDAPRWLLGRTWGEQQRGLRLENRYSEALADALRDLGHINVSRVESFSDLMGHAQAIRIRDGLIESAADPRAHGLAIGF